MVNEDGLDDDFGALFDSEVIKVALNEGRFVEMSRVELSDDKRMASFPIRELIDGLEKHTGDTPTVFTLRWTDRAVSAAGTAG